MKSRSNEGLVGERRQKKPTIKTAGSQPPLSLMAPSGRSRKVSTLAYQAELKDIELTLIRALAQAHANNIDERLEMFRRKLEPSETVTFPVTNSDLNSVRESLAKANLEQSWSLAQDVIESIENFVTQSGKISPHTDVVPEITIEAINTALDNASVIEGIIDITPATVAMAIKGAEVAASRMCDRMDEVLSYMAGSQDRIDKAREAVRAQLAAESERIH